MNTLLMLFPFPYSELISEPCVGMGGHQHTTVCSEAEVPNIALPYVPAVKSITSIYTNFIIYKKSASTCILNMSIW